MATPSTNLVFLPWVRRGLAAAIVRPDAPSGTIEKRATFTVKMTTTSAGQNLDAGVSLPIVGPGDIAGLDSRVIVRTTPGKDESDAEFNHFVSVEFDQADLPWRYTPATHVGQKLHPWLTLIVLKDNEWMPVEATTTQKLPAADIPDISVLPPLDPSWAYAHVQLHGSAEAATNPAALGAVLQGQPGLFVARMLCPRLLAPQTRYTAMLVPTYNHGALAGLGAPILEGTDVLAFAWGAAASVKLPIYYQWQFQTGLAGSFRDLALALKPQPVPGSVGRRNLDVSKPGFDLPNAAPPASPPTSPPTVATAMPMEGALQSLQASLAGEPSPTAAWVTALQSFVNTQKTKINGQPTEIPLVTPPLYGRWHGAETQLQPPPTNRPWFFTLNSDPRDRTAAGLGTMIVEGRHQEFMASAWEQIAGLLDANSERKILQAGIATYNRLFNRHFLVGTTTDSRLMSLGIFQRWTLRAAGDITIHNDFAGSLVGRNVFEPQFRRLARPRGPIGRRQLRHVQGQSLFPLGPVNWLASGLRPAPTRAKPTGMATPSVIYRKIVPGNLTPSQISIVTGQGNDPMLFWGILLFCVARKLLAAGAGRSWWWLVRVIRFAIGLIRLAGGTASTNVRVALRDGTLTAGQVSGLPGSQNFQLATSVPATIPAPPAPTGTDSADAALFRQAYVAMLNGFATPGVPFVPPTQIDVSATSSFFMSKLAPSVTLTASTLARLVLNQSVNWHPADPIEPVQVAPSYEQPMWTPLRDESPDWILPGLDQVATNSVGLVVSNQRFIEGYMVGLNHEMARTLLWNGYPTDQRGTYFRQFWDSRASASTGDLHDIKAITDWGTATLGGNSPRTEAPALVLLIRGDLIHRYPSMVVYALQVPPGTDPSPTLPQTIPLFAGRLTTDVSFYGFSIPRQQSGNYAFVLQEQPAEPRFAAPPSSPPVSPAGAVFLSPTQVAANTAAEFASKTWQRPVRVVIPGSLLVPTT